MDAGSERLKSNAYPGRGIILGLDASGRSAIQIYWITARSAGSKNRTLEIEGEDVRTQPFNPAERSDDPNIWYRAIARAGDRHVVSNGVQTDTIIEHLEGSGSFESALLTHIHETDAPNFTARISGMLDLASGLLNVGSAQPEARLSRISRTDAGVPIHSFHVLQQMTPGIGYCVHTYTGDGDPVPPFTSDPFEVALEGSPQDAAENVWQTLLPRDKRVALALKVIELDTRDVTALEVKNELA